MPELPEVETVRVGLEGAVCGKRIDSVVVNRADLRIPVSDDFVQALSGQVIEALLRRGKYIIFALCSRRFAVLHLGMSGRIRIFDSGEIYVPQKHDHILVRMDGGGVFVFEDPRRFGMFYLARQGWMEESPFDSMGPEPLEAWDGACLFQKLHGKAAPIKTLLLDQRIVAGLGNIYVCEALFEAKICPERAGADLSRAECARLVLCSQNVLNRAIQAGGSTLRDYQKTDGSLGYFQYQFCVYGKEGERCSCGAVIRRIVQSGRSTFFCCACQI